ncbi:biopolymer transport protein ExbB/TolQ [Paenibacillus polymyxa]
MIAWILIGSSTTALLLMLIILFISFLKKKADEEQKKESLNEQFSKKALEQQLNIWFQKGYIVFQRLPFFKSYIWKIRKRLEVIDSFDEYSIRSQTMKISFITLGSTAIIVLLASILSQDLFTIFFILLGAVVANGMMIDTFVNRVEDRLLKQSIVLFEDMRHQFQRTKDVEEALYEANQTAPDEAAKHGERILEVMTGKGDEDKALDTYYEVAPNKFFKLFAGFSFLVSKYGDQKVKKESMYLNALAKLVQEVNYEILRRDKLNYLLKNLSTIAVLTVLFINPIEMWATYYFPIMNDFYESKLGYVLKILFFGLVIICYLLIKKLLANDEARYVAKSDRIMWEKYLYTKVPPIRWIIDRIAPGSNKSLHYRLSMLIKDANSYLTVEWLYIQRVVICIAVFVCSIFISFQMHHIAIHNVLYQPAQSNGFVGKLGTEQAKQAQQETDFDRAVIQSIKSGTDVTPESIAKIVSSLNDASDNDPNNKVVANRIYQKYVSIQHEFYKWWEFLLAIIFSWIAFYIPIWLLYYQKKIRYMEMQDEVDQYHTIISIISHFKRIDVHTILEWMERYSVVFRDQIVNCLNDFDSGQEQALEELKEEVSFEPFIRIVEKLQLAAIKIPILEAFDDLEQTQAHNSRKREEHFNRLIAAKGYWGRNFGFAPGAYLIFCYMVGPLMYVSFLQFQETAKLVQTLSGR